MQRTPSVSSTSSQKSLLQRGLTRAGSILRRKDSNETPLRELVHCAAPNGHVHLIPPTSLDRADQPAADSSVLLGWLAGVQTELPGEALLVETAKAIPESMAMCGARVEIAPTGAHLLLRVIKVTLTGPAAEQACQLQVRLLGGGQEQPSVGRHSCTIMPQQGGNNASEECFLIGLPPNLDVRKAAVEISLEPVKAGQSTVGVEGERRGGGIRSALGGLLQRRNSTMTPSDSPQPLQRQGSTRGSPGRSGAATIASLTIPLRMLCQGRALPARLALHPTDRQLILSPPAEMGGRYLLHRQALESKLSGGHTAGARMAIGEICVHLQATPGSLRIADAEAEAARQASLKPRYQHTLTLWHQHRWQRWWVLLTPDCRLLLLDECRPKAKKTWTETDYLPLEHVTGIAYEAEEAKGDDLSLIPGIAHGIRLEQRPQDPPIFAYADDAPSAKAWASAIAHALHGRAKLSVK